MHVLYVHRNFPAQFGHIAQRLTRDHGYRCTFVSQAPAANVGGIERIHYKPTGGARKETHYCGRTFENQVWHCDAVNQALKKRPDVKPDLIVGHSGFGSTLFLRDLYGDVPIINFFEWFYHPRDPKNDMNFRTDLGWIVSEEKYHRARCRNGMLLLDLQNCDLGYAPTQFQMGQLPSEYSSKMRVIFDGIDRGVYCRAAGRVDSAKRQGAQTVTFGGVEVPSNKRIVTYVSRGFESSRGFDIFMRSADLIAREYPDVIFFVVGADRVAYGGDLDHTGGKSFKEWTLERYKIDLSRFVFTGLMPPTELARLLACTDLHIYLSVPFVLSWSMMNAMSCGALVLASNTPPVQEMIQDGENGLLADFFSPEEFARRALDVLREPAKYQPLRSAAERLIEKEYSLDAIMPRMMAMYAEAVRRNG
jgi:glycosyltransferase involved in cell wall biosynthesis